MKASENHRRPLRGLAALCAFTGIVVATAITGCSNKVTPELVLTASGAPPIEVRDTSGLEEGRTAVFGLTLPAGTRITLQTDKNANLEIPLNPERVSNYLRARIDAEHIEVGPNRTIFENATIRGASGDAKYRIVLRKRSLGTLLGIVQTTDPRASDDRARPPEVIATGTVTLPSAEPSAKGY